MKSVNAWLMRRKFFFQQNYTKINDFGEDVLILEPVFWGNIIFKICFFGIKSHDWGREEFFEQFPQIVTLQSYVINASLYSRCLRFFLQSKSRHFTRESQTMGYLRYFWDRSGKFWKWHWIKTPSSKLIILVSPWRKKNVLRINAFTNLS